MHDLPWFSIIVFYGCILTTKNICLNDSYFGDYFLRQIYVNDIDKIFAKLSDFREISRYGVSYNSIDAANEKLLWYKKIVTKNRYLVGYRKSPE